MAVPGDIAQAGRRRDWEKYGTGGRRRHQRESTNGPMARAVRLRETQAVASGTRYPSATAAACTPLTRSNPDTIAHTAAGVDDNDVATGHRRTISSRKAGSIRSRAVSIGAASRAPWSACHAIAPDDLHRVPRSISWPHACPQDINGASRRGLSASLDGMDRRSGHTRPHQLMPCPLIQRGSR